MPFQFTGFADEAEKSLDGQISTLKEVGWSAIELRLLDGKNFVHLSDEEWAVTWEKLQAENIQVVGFGGAIACRSEVGEFTEFELKFPKV